MRRLLAALAILASAASPASAELGRDDQWSYVAATDDHGARAELRGDGASGSSTNLIFQIECLAAERVLRFRYQTSASGLADEHIDPLMSLIPDGQRPITIRARRVADLLEGDLGLNAETVVAIRDAPRFSIAASNDMGEAWHAGSAPALRRITRECWPGAPD
jgi:hypothetical protein